MSISSITSNSASYYALLASRLQSNGLSVQKASLVTADAKVALEKVAPVQRRPIDKAAMRDALESRISADVSAGKLTKEDAQTIHATLDQMDPLGQAPAENQGLADNASKGKSGHGEGGHGGGGHGGGGAGDSAANKTEVSETVTVIGQIKKTTILYTDGTSETTTKTLTNSVKDSQYVKNSVYGMMKAQAENSDPQTKAANYLATISPGSLFSFTV
jgi:hypothetical protein